MAKTCFFWDELEDNIVEEFDEGGVTIADYTTEPDHFGNVISQHRSAQSSFFHHDALGSSLAVTDESQNVTDTRAYSAFGETTENTGSTAFPFRYVGQKGYYRDELTEQYLVRRRPYEPQRARWLAPDPIAADIHRSLYIYGESNPLVFIDPQGLLSVSLASSVNVGCGKGIGVGAHFSFKLSRPAPCKGHFYQFVSRKTRINRCECTGGEVDAEFEESSNYYEFFKIPLREGATHFEGRDYADMLDARTMRRALAGAQDLMGSCGSTTWKGDVRFYCDSAIPYWTTTRTQGTFPRPFSGPVKESGTAPATYDRPSWWNTVAPVEAVSWHSRQGWVCCKGCPKQACLDWGGR